MKKHLFLALGLCSVVLFSACKSRESAYRAAYEQAKAQEEQQPSVTETTTPTATVPVASETPVVVTPITPAAPQSAQEDHSDVRTIEGGVTVVNGSTLKTYSVVVGSFLTQVNAEGLMSQLKEKGYDARVVKTNETINGQTGWFRVIASSFEDKPSAAQSRDELRGTYPGAWLLYNK